MVEKLVVCNKTGTVRACITCPHGTPHKEIRTAYALPPVCTEETVCPHLPERVGNKVKCVESLGKPKKETYPDKLTEAVARMCHEVNKVWCEYTGDMSQKHWEDAEQWQQDSAVKGVEFVEDNQDAPDSATHDSWMKAKLEDGWVCGSIKDAALKTHPCLVPFKELPKEQQVKDRLFKGVVNLMKRCTK